MTSTAVHPFRKMARAGPRDPQWTPLRAGQIVVAQAAVAGVLAALGHGPLVLATACTLGAAVVIVAFARVRGRWLHSWLSIGIRYAARRHSLPAHATPTELMRFLAPDVALSPDATFVDADGLVTVFEMDEAVVGSEPATLPDLAALHGPAEPHGPHGMRGTTGPHSMLGVLGPHGTTGPHTMPGPHGMLGVPGPHRTAGAHGMTGTRFIAEAPRTAGAGADATEPIQVSIHLLVTATAAPASGLSDSLAGASYRQLTGDRVLAGRRTFVVLRVHRPPGWSDADLRPTLAAVTRRVTKRLGPHRRLDHEEGPATLAELAHHEGAGGVDERWSFVVIGGLCQATYRLTVFGDADNVARLAQRVPTLPTAATTLADGNGSRRPTAMGGDRGRRPVTTLAVRLAATSPEELAHADRALRHLATAERATVRRLDGEHRFATAETLLVGGYARSLGLRPSDPRAGNADQMAGGPPEQPRPDAAHPVAPPPTSTPRPRPRPRPRQPRPARSGQQTATPNRHPLPPAGLVLGYDRYGMPVVARIFRPGATRVVVVGGLRTAHLVAFRALALGARIDVRTRRWAAWSGFADDAGAPPHAITVTPDAAAVPPWAAGVGTPDVAFRGSTHSGPGSNGAGTPLRPTLTIVDAATRALVAAARRSPNGSQPTGDRDQGWVTTPQAAPQTRSGSPPQRTGHGGRSTPRWHATVTIRDELTEADKGLLTAADLVVLDAIGPDEAKLVRDVFDVEVDHLGHDTVALIGRGHPPTWATLAPTPIERSRHNTE